MSNPSSSQRDQISKESATRPTHPTLTCMPLLAGPSSSRSSHFLPTPSTSHISEILTLDSPPDSPAEETITPSFTTTVLRRSPDQKDYVRPAKRVAAPSANREAFDQLRVEASHSKAWAKKVSTERKLERQRFEEENLRFRKDFENLKKHYESEIQALKEQHEIQIVTNDATEGQMADHILQSETERRGMHEEITSLEQLVHEREQTINQLRSDFQQQELVNAGAVNQQSHAQFKHQQQIMQELRSQSENQARLQAQQETEILTLRQRLQHLSATGTSSSTGRLPTGRSSSASPSSNAPVDNPAISDMHPIKARRRHVTSRQSRHMPILPNSNIPIGVVPLAPAGTGTSSGPTDAELNSNRPPVSEDINTLPVETVQRIVKETLQQMGVRQVEVSQSHPSRRRQNHRSTNTTRQLIKEQQDRLSPETDIEWKAAIRDFWRSTYNTRTPKDFSNYVSASTDLVVAVHNGANLPDDTIELDFSRGYEQSRWNTLVLFKHYHTLLDSRAEEGGWGLTDVSEGYLLGLLHGQLKRSREGWAKAQPRFCQETGTVETNEETHQRLAQENEIRYATVASRSRRQTKFTRRVDIVTKVLTFKTHSNACDLNAWKYFKQMLEFLDVDGMSSEEESTLDVSNRTITVYLVKICPWRANEITQYLKLIDQEAKNPAIRSSQGKNAAPRFPSKEMGNTLPKGLPLKMYDAQWVRQMEQQWEDFTTEALEVSRETFEFLTLMTHT